MGKNKKSKQSELLPRVSICTPTFNRRPFFKGLIECIFEQDYPKHKMEWIIIDDGTDCIRDIIESDETKEKLKGIKILYFYEKEKMDLGKKRNYMHKKCSFNHEDDIIVYMDDDDYYPPKRVSHSVNILMKNPQALAGGSSEVYLWFNTLNKMYKFGPYSDNHATAGTFAFRRKLLKDTSYEDNAILAEEKHFLKNYTVPFVQFDSRKTILVVSHEQNTFDKKRLIHKNNNFCKESNFEVKDFIENNELCNFYNKTINTLLKSYEPGNIENKPKVLKEIKRRDEERKSRQNNRLTGIFIKKNNKEQELTALEVREIIEHTKKENMFLKMKLKEFIEKNKKLQEIIDKNKIEESFEVDKSLTSFNYIDTIIKQTECSEDIAKKYLTKHNNDVIAAIVDIQEHC